MHKTHRNNTKTRLAETSAKLVALFETEKYERQIEVKDQKI